MKYLTILHLDRKLLKYIFLFFLVAFFLSGVGAFFGKGLGLAYSSYGWDELFINLVLRYAAKCLFIFIGIWIVSRLTTQNNIPKSMGIALHVFFGIALTFYSIYSQIVLSNWFLGTEDPVTWEYIYTRSIMGTDYNFFLYFSVVAIVFAYNFFKKQKDAEIQQSALRSQLTDAKMRALQSQLQPHFLFNALNDISSLALIDPIKAQDAIADLSDMLRQTLRLNNVKSIPIEQEIILLKKYLALEKIRYQEKLTFEITLPTSLKNHKVPPLLLQPIVENAIKHGYSYNHDVLKIRVEIGEEKNWIYFKISNSGRLLKEPILFGTGITNVLTRLKTLYNDDYSFLFENTETQEVCCTIQIPIVKS